MEIVIIEEVGEIRPKTKYGEDMIRAFNKNEGVLTPAEMVSDTENFEFFSKDNLPFRNK